MKIFFSILLIFFLSIQLKAQIDTSAFQKDLDNILEEITGDKDNSQLYDQIEYLIENPIHINSATEEDLTQIPFIDREDAAAIIQHRNVIGKYTLPSQLKEIEMLGEDVVEKIIPFISFQDEKEFTTFDRLVDSFQSIKLNYRSRTIRDLQQDKATQEGKYYGSDLKFYNRLIVDNKENFHAALVMEKDPGENSITDFTAFHVMIKNLGVVQNLLIGDYGFEFGQGLALWSKAMINKGTETVGITIRESKGIKPYQSTDENMFFRGAAAKFSFVGLNAYTFYSNKKLDGSIDPETNQIKSISTDGYHRDSSEAAHKHIISEKIYGTSLDYTFKNRLNIGLLYYRTEFGNDFLNNSILDPTGNAFDYISANYSFTAGKLSLSGETASDTRYISTINSIMLTMDKNFRLIFSYRNYASHYWNFRATSFGENDGAQNEVGFYTGFHWNTPYGNFNVYYDQFKFPITPEKFLFASKGSDFLIYYTTKLMRNAELRLKYKTKTSEEVTTLNEQLGLIDATSENYRAEFLYSPTRKIELHTRFEIANVKANKDRNQEDGFLAFQDVQYSPTNNLDLKARIVFYKTDSYNSRIYEYESDLSGVMTTPALYGEGMRWYLVAKYKTKFGLDFTLKFSETYKPEEKSLGSGDTLINSNVDNRLSLQLDYKL